MGIPQTFEHGLRPLQVVGSVDILEKRRILLADQPGAGKTAQALFALEMDGIFDRESVTLILCNVTGCQLTWSPEIRDRVATQHDIIFADLTNTGTDSRGRQKKTMPSVAARDDILAVAAMDANDRGLPLVVLANYDLVNVKYGTPPKMTTLFDLVFDAVLIDESHLVLPTEKDHPKQTTQFWTGLQMLQIRDDAIRLSMSGTPDRGKLERRYGHWKFLHPNGYRDYRSWLNEHFEVSFEKVGYNPAMHKDIFAPVIGKLKHPERWEMFDRMTMIRRTKKEMLKGLPEKQWANEGGIVIPMTPLQDQAYRTFQADLNDRYDALMASDDEADQRKAAGLKLQFSLRARQQADCIFTFNTTVGSDGKEHTNGVPQVKGVEGSGKLAWTIDWLTTRGYVKGVDFDASQGKVVIVSFFTEVLDWLKLELDAAGVDAKVMSGATSAPDKKAIEQEFQRGDLRVILLSGYLGVSINLDAADDLIFFDSIHDPDKMEQAEDRIHRASRNHQVTYHRLASEDTVDVAILEIIDARFHATRRTYDGARQVEFARKMLNATAPKEMETLV